MTLPGEITAVTCWLCQSARAIRTRETMSELVRIVKCWFKLDLARNALVWLLSLYCHSRCVCVCAYCVRKRVLKMPLMPLCIVLGRLNICVHESCVCHLHHCWLMQRANTRPMFAYRLCLKQRTYIDNRFTTAKQLKPFDTYLHPCIIDIS